MLYEDYFDNTSIDHFWVQSFDSTGNYEYTITAGDGTTVFSCLRIYSGSGDYENSPNGIYQDTTGDFDIELKIHPQSNLTHIANPGDYGFGLMVRTSSSNYYTISKTANNFGGCYSYNYDFNDGESVFVCTSHILPPFYFRFKRVGNTFTPYFATSPGAYYEGVSRVVYGGTNVQVWVFANHPSEDKQFFIDIDWFKSYSG